MYTPPKVEGEGTRAAPVKRALPLKEAYGILRADDPRPLLVLREFSTFDDPDNEKLSRELYTEATVTLSHWFRCVRLPHHALQADHPFHNLFAQEDAPQIFFASNDGKVVRGFDHRNRRDDLADAMLEVLAETYEAKPQSQAKQLVKLLPQFDRLDATLVRLKEEVDLALEEHGPRHARVAKLQKKLNAAQKEMDQLLATQRTLQDIPLKAE